MPRPLLPESKTAPAAQSAQAAFHAATVNEVAATVARDRVVVIGMAWNTFVKRARSALTAADVEHTYLEYGNYVSMWKPRLAIKLWSGWPTFPQVYVDGTLIGGYKELAAEIASGALKARLD